MRVSLEWLREYVDLPAEPDELDRLLERLVMAGLEVEAVSRPVDGAGGIWTGQVVAVKPHPDADHLQLVDLDLGDQGEVQVVSGATNYRAGDIVPVVLAGGSLPGGKTIGVTEFRGVVSGGMMCSAAELGLDDGPGAGDGIMILPPETALGADCVAQLGLDDQVLELDLTPNYAVFCQSMLGVAREVAAITGTTVREPLAVGSAPPELFAPDSAATTRAWAEGAAAEQATVRIAAPEDCGRYSGAVFEVAVVGPSPWWMRRRLLAAGVRPINNIVDVTNYVMLELGQPLHAFDLDAIAGGEIVVREAGAGERLVTLDGVDRKLPAGALVIADRDRGIALAGVMGGHNTEVGEATGRLFLESASFARTSVRRTSRRLGLRSEASKRFEKGVDPALTVLAIERASELLAAVGAARRVPGIIDVVARAVPPRRIEARLGYVRTLTGLELSGEQMVGLLAGLGIGSELAADPAGEAVVRATVPTRRLDVEGPADLAEEIARAYGYDRLPTELPAGPMPAATLAAERREALALRRELLGLGLDELVTYAYHRPGELDRLRLPDDHPWRQSIPVLNPMNEDQATLRVSLVPNLLRVLAYNAGHGHEAMAAFEIGRVYLARELPLGELPDEPFRLAVVMTGPVPGTANWRDGGREADYYALKGVVEAALAVLRAPPAAYERLALPFMHPGRTARLAVAGREVGWLGEVHPTVAADYGLRGRPCLAELDLPALRAVAGSEPRFSGVPRYPALTRDLAFVVDAGVPAAEIEGAIRAAGGDLLREIHLFDVYEGDQVGPGRRSLAYSLRLRAAGGTLTDDAADEVIARIVAAAAELGAELRS